MTDIAVVEGMSIEVLAQLATDVLTSPDKTVRDSAAARLRFMTSYVYWDVVKNLLPRCQNNYLRFVVCKAIRFIVINELGPQERKETQVYIMDYLKVLRERGEELPIYIKNELYSIYASALFVNWRMMVLARDDVPEGIGLSIIEELSAQLPVDDVLACLLEILTYFSRQEKKISLIFLRSNFLDDILPNFFSFSVGQISSCGSRALEVCCTILQVVPTLYSAALITVQRKVDDSIDLGKSKIWLPAISLAVQDCRRVILENPMLELSGHCARLLRMASSVVYISAESLEACSSLGDLFLELSSELLYLYESTGFSYLLQLSCALLVNMFGHDKVRTLTYFDKHLHLVIFWANMVSDVLNRWEDGEEELRQEVMHLFYIFGDCIAPRVGAEGSKLAEIELILSSVSQVAECYFDNVVAKAHLTEDSSEIRSDMGVMLHNEKTLLPIAEMLFCDTIGVYGLIARRLQNTIEQYGICVRIRDTGSTEEMGNLLLSLAVDVQSVCSALGAVDTSLFLMHVCLSRLSVIISAVAIAVLNNTVHRSNKLIEIVAHFARDLLSVDDSLTSALLESLSLTEVKGENSERRSMTGVGKAHMGILRALFFFCGCVYESLSEASCDFYDIMNNLLYYVYVYHSDKTCLTIDANLLLGKVLMQGVHGFFLGSEKMSAVLLAVKEERIDLLRVSSEKLTSEDRKARSSMLSVLTFFDEGRHYAGFPTLDFIPCIMARALDLDRLNTDPHAMLHDLSAIVDGIHQSDVFYWLLDALIQRIQEIEELPRVFPDEAPLLLQLVAKLCDLATDCLMDDSKCEAHWALLRFASIATTGIINRMGLSNLNLKESVQELPLDVVNEVFLYNVADIVYDMITGNWCNVGVALFYSEDFLSTFTHFFTLLFATPAELIMSHTGSRERVFQLITKAITTTENICFELHGLFGTRMMWEPLLRCLLKCLQYSLLVDVLLAIDTVLLSLGSVVEDHSKFVEDEVTADIFEAVVVHIVVSSGLEQHEMGLSFNLLRTCFQWCESACTARIDKLLGFCAAHHRVRFRHILTLLRSGRKDVLHSYTLLFDKGSAGEALAPW
ncbi:hypothetical protein TraAM80_01900 [Trypanosoma rangeli]|uniref:Uncharacterized protein n=1 Tax=Trypanosoma rangeli TaxID=5698 RepID=A0A3R7NQ84_TRYRA|nr:uncharacterized protein TraAM80_01900 [Trypanosoma rangeli]RNF09874.1 hypothetical protein TraAM80_01900 [Trypanosoma rangeli]|eukprot:RNF09874.1 hypothetical protein TraAM80_01900 [Trypanosoma rangeli]